MKRIITALLVAACLAVPAVAQDDGSGSSSESARVWDHGDNVSDIYYVSVPVYKVLDHRDAYVVLYQKQSLDVGRVVIPKQWGHGNKGRKLFFRDRPSGLGPTMTVYYKGGEFYKVRLTVPTNRADPVWGVVPNATKLAGTDADTLEVEY